MIRKMMNLIRMTGVFWKIPVAAAASWELAKWAGTSHPYLAPLTVILTIQITVDESIRFAWQRIIGTMAGVLFAASIAPYISVNGWSIGLLLLVGAVIAIWLKWSHAMMIQVALSILLVMSLESKMPTYPLDRIRDTAIGAGVAVLIHILIFPPDSINEAKKKMIRLADHLTELFVNTAQWVKQGCDSLKTPAIQAELSTLFRELHQTTIERDKAEQSLRYNPLAQTKRNALNQISLQLQQLRSGYANLADMVRIFKEGSENRCFSLIDQQIWAEHLHTIASLITEWKGVLGDPPALFIPNRSRLRIEAPFPIENNRYSLALYMNAEQIVQDFQKWDFSNDL